MSAKPYAISVGDPYPARHDVVDHPRELVDAEDREVLAREPAGAPYGLEVVHRARTGTRPHDVGQDPEDAVEVHLARLHEPVAQEVESEIGVWNARGRRVEVDLDDHGLGTRLAAGVGRHLEHEGSVAPVVGTCLLYT